MATAKKAATPARKAAPAKPASQAAAAPSAMPETRPASKAKAAGAAKTAKLDKPKKPKLVRDSFTIPKAEYVVLEQLKKRAAQSGTPAKKSEVLRAGLKALAGMEDAAFAAALGAVPALKTGRPAKS
jgi:hypothetical protein